MNNVQKQRNPSPWPMRIFLSGVLVLLVFLSTLCSCTSAMAMPDNCKPPKKKEYKMIEPDNPMVKKDDKYKIKKK